MAMKLSRDGLFRKCTTRIGLLALFVLVSTPVVGQPIVGHQRKVDIRAHWGYTAVSSRDAPSQAAVVLVEHEFWSYERLNPYLVLGVTLVQISLLSV